MIECLKHVNHPWCSGRLFIPSSAMGCCDILFVYQDIHSIILVWFVLWVQSLLVCLCILGFETEQYARSSFMLTLTDTRNIMR
jgi:hypothetical protein